MLTQDELMKYIKYDPVTGDFFKIGFFDKNGNYKIQNKKMDTPSSNGYIVVTIRCKRYFLHRLAFLYVYGEMVSDNISVDHINGDKCDNRLVNLRLVDHKTNHRNKKISKLNKTGASGVSLQNGKYRARIYTDDGRVSLGMFNTIEDAHLAVLKHRSLNGYHENHGRVT